MRTTVEKVREIIETELTDINLEGYITGASTLLDKVLAGKSIPEALLAEIERWLTGHFITASKERQAKKEGAGGAFIEYAGIFGEGLKCTSYGQMVLTLDYTGTMATLTGKNVIIKAIKS